MTAADEDYAGCLRARFRDQRARIGVVGLGYVGEALVSAFVEAGLEVVGVDNDPARVQSLAKTAAGRRLAALSCDLEAVVGAEAIVLCLPTPLTEAGAPDLAQLQSVLSGLHELIEPGTLVVVESTVYPGYTAQVAAPLLAAGKLDLGRELFVACSPERFDPGNQHYPIQGIPKVVGGVTPTCTQVAEALYKRVVETVVAVRDASTAEMVKLSENSFRAVNLALVNELARGCRELGVSVWEMLEAADTKPFGYMRFDPGPGVGGHCIPVDPLYLAWRFRALGVPTDTVETAARVNGAMPAYCVERIEQAIGRSLLGASVVVVGVGYKPNQADTRRSPAVAVLKLLRERGAHVGFVDPLVDHVHLAGERLQASVFSAELTAGADVVALLNPYEGLDGEWLLGNARLVFDARNHFGARDEAHIERL